MKLLAMDTTYDLYKVMSTTDGQCMHRYSRRYILLITSLGNWGRMRGIRSFFNHENARILELDLS